MTCALRNPRLPGAQKAESIMAARPAEKLRSGTGRENIPLALVERRRCAVYRAKAAGPRLHHLSPQLYARGSQR
ncbi:hypothetical protein VTO73DRAFT_5859 [Trametes versicolor]